MNNIYFIFDMDETLAQLYSVYYFVITLRLKELYEDGDDTKLYNNIPESLLKSLDDAYKLFVKRVLQEEKSSKPLGILRPGILNVMNELNKLKKQVNNLED
jgi:hypothetical protein